MTLDVLRETYCICRLDPADLPEWARQPPDAQHLELFSVTRTRDELSIVCPSHLPPVNLATRSDGWRCLRIRGLLDLSLTGVVLRVLQPLADAECPVFTLATYDTDYVLVRDRDLARALAALRAAGHVVHD